MLKKTAMVIILKNNEYWQKRFVDLQKAKEKNVNKYINVLREEYEKALLNIEKDISNWYIRLANNNEVNLASAKKLLDKKELQEFKWSVDEYIEKGKENKVNGKWIKELENASARVHIDRLEAIKIQIQNELEHLEYKEQTQIKKLIENQYKDAYYKTGYEIQKGMEKYWNIQALDTNKIEKVISKPWTTDNQTFSNRIWKNKEDLISTLQRELTQAIIRGNSLDNLTKSISKKFNTSISKASRLVMTESAFFSSVGQQECFNNLGVEEYEIVATLDVHTSEICQELDGKVFKMKDYKVGLTAPPFHVNCRSTTAPYFNDEFTKGEKRAYRDENGKTGYVDSDISYKEWKEKYVTNKNIDDIIKNIPKFRKTLIKGQQKQYSVKEIEQISQETNIIANKYTNNTSKWSGRIIQSNRKISAKLWNCNIEIEPVTSPHVILHEHLHAHSISYYDRDIYKKYKNIEEATVEFYTKEIGKQENIINVKSEYDNLVENLKLLNNKLKLDKNNFDFAQRLFNIPVLERLDFLESEIQKYLVNKSINEAIEINKLMEVLYD